MEPELAQIDKILEDDQGERVLTAGPNRSQIEDE
jgi:hypothetical protein